MPQQLIQPQPTSTPSGGPFGRTADRTIPADLLRDASKRLAVMALMAAVLWLLGNLFWHLAWPSFHPGQKWPGLGIPDFVVWISSASSFTLYLYFQRHEGEPDRLLRIGLVYMVLTCLAISLVMHLGLPETESLKPEISWIAVVILMFAAIVPVRPRDILIASIIGASMGPLGMMATRVHGMSAFEALKSGILMHYSDFLIAGAAIVVSRVVTRLGQQVSKAREMGSYQLGELISKGGMGEVYRATHRMLARPAAIKLIRTEMLGTQSGETSEIAVKRFHREAEAAANLRSAHTVELFDFGITEDRTLYFVMELLDGMNLETLVRETGPMPARRVIHILVQVCDSLEEAHSQGLIHRDIKPANIHLGKVGMKHDFAKVLDFGLVKSVHKEDTQISLATAVGRTPGTPSYMAPEMALGENVDARADIYALGCVAYFLLTAKLVFDAETTFQMIAKHMRNQPVPPSLRAGVEVPLPLEDLIVKCLAKRPEDRPASARDLREALEAIRIPKWTEAEAAAWWRGQPERVTPGESGAVSPGSVPVTGAPGRLVEA